MLDEGEAIGQFSADGPAGRERAAAALWRAARLDRDGADQRGVPPPRPRDRQPAVDARALPRARPDRRPRRHARRRRGLPAARLRGGLRAASAARRARGGSPGRRAARSRSGRCRRRATSTRSRGSMPACSAIDRRRLLDYLRRNQPQRALLAEGEGDGSRASSWRAPDAGRCTSARWSRRTPTGRHAAARAGAGRRRRPGLDRRSRRAGRLPRDAAGAPASRRCGRSRGCCRAEPEALGDMADAASPSPARSSADARSLRSRCARECR